ncbi:MAG TPA: PQQ-binding-like beta-propeller repeat protein [Vicinamibacterales bacterium]|nr:PQQ-binding-like beta-propeller repeat protein [Vicinamibacterales bacterium]
MKRVASALVLAVLVAASLVRAQQTPAFPPVTEEMLLKPSVNDWLMFSRTYDAQRHSPLEQINTKNVSQLREVFKKEMPAGVQESIPIVYRGVMYVLMPGNTLQALDATNGNLIWEYKRPSGATRSKAIAIYEDMIFNTTPDGFITAIDARTGQLRWETKSSGRLTAGAIVVEGKVLTGRACAPRREDCYLAAHDAKTGKEVWRFYTAAASNEPGGDTWGGAPDETRAASTWALPGGYDPVRRLIYWGVANPTPNTRADRHGGNTNAIPTESPADLYSNSTIALDPDTGKLRWYYQHLPGDDWDEDYPNERTLLRTPFNPDPKFVKWINPDVKRGEQRDVSVMVGEGGGIFVIDRSNGQFLWGHPFPFDTPDFLISNIDGRTGRVSLNKDKLFKGPNDRRVICYWNTRSYWPTAYHPGVNSLFVPYVENCLDMTTAGPGNEPRERRVGIPRPGSDPNTWAGLMKINMATGEMKPIHAGRAPSNGAVLTTAGNVVFWGDLDQKFRAFDVESGKVLWEQTLGGPVQNSTITYSVNGKQYIAVLTGSGALSGGLMDQAGIKPNRAYNSLYVFALP